jgi:ADP-ribose pyrophosphatase
MIILGRDELADVPLAWPVASSTVLAEGTITKYVQDQVRTPDGHLITREYLKHPGAVGVIALDDHERVALVRQYRHPVRHRLILPVFSMSAERIICRPCSANWRKRLVWRPEGGPC